MELIWNENELRYETKSTYEERHISKEARFRWDSKARLWWTDDETKAMKLLRYAEGSVALRLQKIKDAHTSALEASSATDSDIEVPAPEGREYLPFQKAGIAYALKGHTLIADEMGLGKTVESLGVINATPDAENVLVICPASLRLNWAQEAERWLTAEHWNIKIVDSKNPASETDNFIIINYDIVAKQKDFLHSREWDVMVADECHYMKNAKTQRSKAV